MKATGILLIVISALHFNSYSQLDSIPKNIVHLEAGGPSIIGSINYERHFLEKAGFGLRANIGVGSSKMMDFTRSFNPDFSIPIGIIGSYKLFDVNHAHVDFELGVGNTFSSTVLANSSLQTERLLAFHGYAKTGLSLLTGFKLFVRLCYTPILVDYSEFRHWGALSLGYSF